MDLTGVGATSVWTCFDKMDNLLTLFFVNILAINFRD